MKIFAIVVTYNACRWLDRCFGSLRCSSVPVHTIVVDNFSQDDTAARLEEQYPEVELVRSAQNLGFGQANNLAVKMAMEQGADYILLLNQDAWIFENTLESLLAEGAAVSQVGILSPVHIDASEKALDLNFEQYLSKQNIKLRAKDEPSCPEFMADPFELGFVNAAAWLLPRQTIDKVGGFDPIFFHYGEDINYVNRVHYHGLKVVVVPESFAVHDRADVIVASEGQSRWTRSILVVEMCNINRSFVGAALKTLPLFIKMLLLIKTGNKYQRSNSRAGFNNFFARLLKIVPSRRRMRKGGFIF